MNDDCSPNRGPTSFCTVVSALPHSVLDTKSCVMQGVGKEEMKSGKLPIIGATKIFSRPGIYSLEVSTIKRFNHLFVLKQQAGCSKDIQIFARPSHADLRYHVSLSVYQEAGSADWVT